jgi:hypothetical protein
VLVNVEPAHRCLQQVVVIACGGFLAESVDLFLGQINSAGGTLAKAEHHKGVAVIACQLDGDVGIFGFHVWLLGWLLMTQGMLLFRRQSTE